MCRRGRRLENGAPLDDEAVEPRVGEHGLGAIRADAQALLRAALQEGMQYIDGVGLERLLARDDDRPLDDGRDEAEHILPKVAEGRAPRDNLA